MRFTSHHRARRETRSLPAPEQLSLPFEWKELACAYQISKSFTVDRPTLAAFAKSSCDQASQARADLHCSGVILSR